MRLNFGDFAEKGDGSAKVSILGKGCKRKEVVISQATWDLVKALMHTETKKADPVFTANYRGEVECLSETKVLQIVKDAAVM